MKEYQNSEAVLPDISLSVLKLSGSKNASTGRSQRHCTCDDPCTASSCGRMVYIYPEKDLRAYPGAIRGTEEWNNTYKIRTTVERDINHIKDNLCLAGRRTQNEKTLHADLILAGITQLITVVLSDKINHHEFIRKLKTSYCLGLTNSIKSTAYLSAPKTQAISVFVIKIMLCSILFLF